VSHLTTALALLKALPDASERGQQELTLLTVLGIPLVQTKGHAAAEVATTYGRARELCQQLGDSPQLFSALVGLMRFYFHRGELRTAHDLGKQLLHLAERLDNSGLVVRAHHMLAENLLWRGKFAGTREHAEQGLARYDPQQHRALMFRYGTDSGVGCRVFAAFASWALGYPDQARQQSEEALAWAQALGHPFSLGLALFQAARLHQLRREVALTQMRAEAVIALATEQGFAIWIAMGPILRGWALAEQGQAADGLAEIRQGLAAWQAIGSQIRAVDLALLVSVYGQVGQAAEGLRVLAEAQAAAQTTGELYRLEGALRLAQSAENHTAAETCFQQALAVGRRQEAKSLELRAAMSLSRLWQHQGRHKEAYELLARIYGWFSEGFDTADLQEAKALLAEVSR
jgi:predicted ATPase